MFQLVVFFFDPDHLQLLVKVEIDLLKRQLVLPLKLSDQINVSLRFQIPNHLVFSREIKQLSFNIVQLFSNRWDRVLKRLFGCVAL